jgi:hypothetical protein
MVTSEPAAPSRSPGRLRRWLTRWLGLVPVSDVVELEAAYAELVEQTHRRGWRSGFHFGGFLVWDGLRAAGRPAEAFAGRALCCWPSAPSDSATIEAARVERVVSLLGLPRHRRVTAARLPFAEVELEHADTGSIPVPLRLPLEADGELVAYLRRHVLIHYLRDGRGFAGDELTAALWEADGTASA